MIVKRVVLAAVALTATVSMAAADAHWSKAGYRTRVVIHPRTVGTYPGWSSGSNAYPAHRVPLAAYPSPGGIGITFEPFGWRGSTGWGGATDAPLQAAPNTRLKIVSTCLK